MITAALTYTLVIVFGRLGPEAFEILLNSTGWPSDSGVPIVASGYYIAQGSSRRWRTVIEVGRMQMATSSKSSRVALPEHYLLTIY